MGSCDEQDRGFPSSERNGSTTNQTLEGVDDDDRTDDSALEDAAPDIVFHPQHENYPDDGRWSAVSQGYTPLADLRTMANGESSAVLFSTGPTGVTDGEGGGGTTAFYSNPGAFFADMSAFGPLPERDGSDNDDDEENQDHDQDDNHDEGRSHVGQQDREGEDSFTGFRDVADQALRVLEEDYRRTLEGARQVGGGGQNEQVASWMPSITMPTAVASSDPNSFEFEANFGDAKRGESRTADTDTADADADNKELPDIDTDAVRRAVRAIRLRNPGLQRNLSEWELSHREAMCRAPRSHSVVPSGPLSAFRKKTKKAVRATANLTRSACLAEACCRLDLLRGQDRLIVHAIGCDGAECASPDRVRFAFGPIVRWIGAHPECPTAIEFVLVGPNLPTGAVAVGGGPGGGGDHPFDLLPAKLGCHSPLQSARAYCYTASYHEWMAEKKNDLTCASTTRQKADLIVAFNAGIWGYDEWLPTLQFLAKKNKETETDSNKVVSVPFVVTAYTFQEAEEDYVVLERELATRKKNTEGMGVRQQEEEKENDDACLWEPELNPYASKEQRETATAPEPGRRYHENAAWQAWRVHL